MPMSSLGSSRRGFSLLEIIVVLVLLAVTAAVVAPSFSRGLKGMKFRSASRDLATHMRAMRTKAVSSQQVHRVLIGIDGDGKPFYTLADQFERDLREPIPLPDQTTITEIVSENDTREVLAGSAPVRVSFYPNGRSSGGVIVLKQGRRELVLQVDPITGYAKVLRPGESEGLL